MVNNTYAFWSYDLFPYVLGGKVKKINKEGLVYIDAYQGWFKPLFFLPEEQGINILNKLKEIRIQHDIQQKNLNEIFLRQVNEVLPITLKKK